jgi:hypothetical protein
LVRNQNIGVPLKVRTHSKSRKRLDVPLGIPGAEIRLPALPQIRLGWRLISFVLTLVFGGLLAFLWTSPTFQVQAAGVGGSERETPEDVNLVVGVAGESIFSIDKHEVYSDIYVAFPEMSAITVEIKLPATISVTLTERQPVIAWFASERVLHVDAQGTAWPARSEIPGLIAVQSEMALPPMLISGTVAAPFLSPADVNAILTLKDQVPAGSVILFDAEHGAGWNDSRGWKVYFGFDLSQMSQKLNLYVEIIDELKQKGITPKFVSVEFIHAPYYRAEP